ncbi:hypothetical protein MP638_007198, partial [Amoeboaphelidium occidentale]
MFLGFVNFYRRLIPQFATLTQPLTDLLRKDSQFLWQEQQENAFKLLKESFREDLLLLHPQDHKPFIVETDSSDYGIGGVLSQFDDQNVLRPVAFYSRQLNSAERNYEIYDKELLAVHDCFKEWRHYLQGGRYQVTVLSDHKNLEYFMSSKQLTRRQARWSLFLNEFDWVITHIPGKLNVKADILSRRPDYHVETEEQNYKVMIKPEQIVDKIDPQLISLNVIHSDRLNKDIDFDLDWPMIIADFLLTDRWLEIPDNQLAFCKKELKNFKLNGPVLLRILDDKRSTRPFLRSEARHLAFKRFHDHLGHLKYDSIIDLIKRRYWWPSMDRSIKDFIARCPECQLDRSANSVHSQPPLRPLPPVALPFERWGIDFVQNLPLTKSGKRHIITAIDYATRWFLYNDIFMNFGSPFELISDRGTAFLAESLLEYEKMQGIKHISSTAHHAQTNGMVERMHSMLGHSIT